MFLVHQGAKTIFRFQEDFLMDWDGSGWWIKIVQVPICEIFFSRKDRYIFESNPPRSDLV
jgi:hypothetical protein